MIPLARKLENLLEPRLDAPIEHAYRYHYTHSDSLVSRLNAGFWLFICVLFAYSDFVFLGDDPRLVQALLLRGFILLVVGAYFVRLGRPISPAAYDRLTLLMWLTIAVWMLYFQAFLRPVSHVNYYTMDILLLMCMYFVVPGTFWSRLTPALIYTVGHFYIYFFVKIPQPPAAVIVFVTSYLIVNTIGVYISTRYYSFRRQEFLTRRHDAAMRDKLAELATRDELTGAMNRRGFFRRAEEEFAVHTLHKTPLSLLVIDIDHFKAINDTYGHHVGDAVLKAFVSYVRDSSRESDCFGRTGGEEFALLLPHTGGDRAVAIAERLRLHCARLPGLTGTARPDFTISIGVAQAQPADTSIYEVQRRADKALYLAKGGGRNQVHYIAGHETG